MLLMVLSNLFVILILKVLNLNMYKVWLKEYPAPSQVTLKKIKLYLNPLKLRSFVPYAILINLAGIIKRKYAYSVASKRNTIKQPYYLAVLHVPVKDKN